MSQNQSRKLTPAQRRAEEALDQIAKASAQPTKKVLDFLLAGSHDSQEPGPDPTQTSPNPVPQALKISSLEDQTPQTTIDKNISLDKLSKTRPNPDQSQPSTRTSDFIKTDVSIAPSRDFNRRANSIDREALPAGAFPGASKKLYDCLYLRTRGAIKPTRTVQATRRELIRWSGIKNIKTINAHIKRLSQCGLIKHSKYNGDHEGSLYEVFLPEEARPDPTQTSPNPRVIQKTAPDQDQNLGWAGSGKTTEVNDFSIHPNTSFKTNTKNDDEAFTELINLLKEVTGELTGKTPSAQEKAKWREVAEIIVGELKSASSKTISVSSVPAFLAEHLRRRLQQTAAKDQGGTQTKRLTPPPLRAGAEPQQVKKLTDQEISDMATMVKEFMAQEGYSIKHAEAQFKASFLPADWQALLDALDTEAPLEFDDARQKGNAD